MTPRLSRGRMRVCSWVGVLASAVANPFGSVALAKASPVFADMAESSGLSFRYFNGMSGELYIPEIMGGGGALFDCDDDGDLDVFLAQGRMLGPGKTHADALFPAPDPSAIRDRLFRNELTRARAPAAPDSPPGALHFTDVTAQSGIVEDDYGMAVLAADLDGDGRTDLYVANLERNRFWRNVGDCRFEDATEESGLGDESWSMGAVAFDYDRDGLLDLYVVNYLDFRYYRHRKCSSESVTEDYCGPRTYPGQTDRLFHNEGDGVFLEVTAAAGVQAPESRGMAATAADFDGDGLLDVYVANDQMPNHLWINQGNGTFVDVALLSGVALDRSGRAEASMGVDASDLDADGDEDLFIANLTGESNTLYVNAGELFFDDASAVTGLAPPSLPYTGFGAAALDFDGDGCLDLAVVNGAIKTLEDLALAGDRYPLHQRNHLFRCIPGSELRYASVDPSGEPELARSEVSRGLAVGDVDNDGRPDLLVVNSEGPTRLLVNQTPQRAWVGIELEGTRSPHGGLGTSVTLHPSTLQADTSIPGETPPQPRLRARADGSYASSHDPRILFTLGDRATAGGDGAGPVVHRARVEWTSGLVEDFDVETGRYQVLVEGRGDAVEEQDR